MIRFKVGSTLFEFRGTIDVSSETKYRFEKRNPFQPNLFYRYGRYFEDVLVLMIVSTAIKYEELYFAAMNSDSFFVSWETVTGYQYRQINKDSLPYPSSIRFLNGAIELRLRSKSYEEPMKNMPNITRNTIWNQSTISNTIWVG